MDNFRNYILGALLALAFFCAGSPVSAQIHYQIPCVGGSPNGKCDPVIYSDANGQGQVVDAAHPLPTNGGTVLGTVGDTHTAGTVVGFLKDIWTAITGTLNVAGTTSNGVSGVAASSNNVPVDASLKCWNGATYDPCAAINAGTAGSPTAQVLTVQLPKGNGSYPTGATPLLAVGTGTTAAVTATLAGTSGKTTYICGFKVTATATAATAGAATVSGLIGGVTFTYQEGVGTVASIAAPTTDNWPACLPASATNTAIVVTSAAAGTGGVTDVNSWGYQQ